MGNWEHVEDSLVQARRRAFAMGMGSRGSSLIRVTAYLANCVSTTLGIDKNIRIDSFTEKAVRACGRRSEAERVQPPGWVEGSGASRAPRAGGHAGEEGEGEGREEEGGGGGESMDAAQLGVGVGGRVVSGRAGERADGVDRMKTFPQCWTLFELCVTWVTKSQFNLCIDCPTFWGETPY